MPEYLYLCTSCGHEWEHQQSIKSEALKDCPICNKQTAKRLISGGVNFVLNGGGWAKEGYSSK